MMWSNILALLACTAFLASGARISQKIVQCGSGNSHNSVCPASAKSAIVQSYNYGNGNSYNNNEDCSIEFSTDSEPLVFTLTFTHFDLENEYTCRYDSLCVAGIKYCANSLADSTLSYRVPEYSSFTVRFDSDSSITRSGFEFVVETATDEQGPVDNYVDSCKTGGNPVQNPWWDYSQNPWEDNSNQPWEDYSQNPWENTSDQPWEDYSQNPWEDYSQNPWENTSDQPWEDYSQNPWENTSDQPWEDYSQNPWENTSDQPWEDYSQNPWENTSDQPWEDYSQNPFENTSDQPWEDYSQNPWENTSDQPWEDYSQNP